MTMRSPIMYWLSMKNLRAGSAITMPITATAFSLRLRLHYKAARVGGVISTLAEGRLLAVSWRT
ncbi:hypothetical protein C1H66_20655 [Halomonas heilongjiangensis]|uniref:Uncharacterized protein n=1 Tax=Halomonas heilongjiangensis TaxID=1387883 RepID=A0A2N7TFX9_9GAMM|nr:hypothetical protein C1H66_20655 [Halomonas heilongjiangensis]